MHTSVTFLDSSCRLLWFFLSNNIGTFCSLTQFGAFTLSSHATLEIDDCQLFQLTAYVQVVGKEVKEFLSISKRNALEWFIWFSGLGIRVKQ